MLKRPSNIAALSALALVTCLQCTPATAQATDPYLGQIMCGAWNFAPRGWMPLDGRLLPINQYTALFSLLGTTYGGNGFSNFALPDLRGRVPMGAGQGPGLSPRALGESAGIENQSITVAQMPPHNHTFAPLGSNNDANSVSPEGKVPAAKARTMLYTDPTNLVNEAAGVTSIAGLGQPMNNMQPYLTFTCVIAVQGVFPSRN